MATLETLTVDVVQETIHDQIRKLAETVYEQSGVKLEEVRISWGEYIGLSSHIFNINIETSKE